MVGEHHEVERRRARCTGDVRRAPAAVAPGGVHVPGPSDLPRRRRSGEGERAHRRQEREPAEGHGEGEQRPTQEADPRRRLLPAPHRPENDARPPHRAVPVAAGEGCWRVQASAYHPPASEQRLVRALLHDPPCDHDVDPVRPPTVTSRWAMTSAVRPGKHRFERGLHLALALGVEAARRLVQHQNSGVPQHRPGERQPLPLAPAESRPPLAERRVATGAVAPSRIPRRGRPAARPGARPRSPPVARRAGSPGRSPRRAAAPG